MVGTGGVAPPVVPTGSSAGLVSATVGNETAVVGDSACEDVAEGAVGPSVVVAVAEVDAGADGVVDETPNVPPAVCADAVALSGRVGISTVERSSSTTAAPGVLPWV